MNDDLLPLEDVRFIQIRGEPGCGAWIDGCEATPLTAYGAPEALHAWHIRWRISSQWFWCFADGDLPCRRGTLCVQGVIPPVATYKKDR